jgi:hypothetical protein
LLWLVAAIWWVGAASASAAQPIQGDWQVDGGALIRVVMTGGGHFQGTVVTAGGPCSNQESAGAVVWRNMTGSGSSYSGARPWYQQPSCDPLGDGQATWTLSSNDQGSLEGTDPTNPNHKATQTFHRVGPPPTAEVVGVLPVLVNAVLLDLQRSYRKLSGASKKQKVSLFRSVAQRANKGLNQVNNYKATSSEQALKGCAKGAISEALRGARARSRGGLAAGMLNIARCLKPFKVLFPGGKPGAKPPPQNQQQRGPTEDYVGVGTDPNLIPRFDFSFDRAKPFPPPVINLHASLRVACVKRGVFYLELDSHDFPPPDRSTDAFGRFVTFGAETYVQGLKVDFGATVEGGGGVHGTLQAQTDPSTSTDTCSSSNNKRWYAHRVN